ncbi:transmembrane protein 209-like isoform X2 [Oratosquilla oratoria]
MQQHSSSFLRDALERKSANNDAYLAICWGSFNILLLAIIAADMHLGGLSSSSTFSWYFELGLALMCSFNVLVYVKQYLKPSIVLPPIEVTDKQRQLLDVKETDLGFKSATPKKACSTPQPDKNISLSSLFAATSRNPIRSPGAAVSPLSSMSSSAWSSPTASPVGPYSPSSMQSGVSSLNMSASSAGGSVTANSWSFHHNTSLPNTSYNIINSPQHHSFSPSQMSESLLQVGKTPPPPLDFGSPIKTETQLTEYLKDYEDKEKRRHMLSQSDSGASMGVSLWAYGASPHNQLSDYGHVLRKNLYHVATKTTDQLTNSSDNKNDDSKTSNLSSSSVSKIWRKRNVTQEQLFQYVENLRMWFSSNVLCPIVKAIEQTNQDLTLSAPEVQIGGVGVDKLRKTAQNILGVKQLADLIPFLDMTLHQDYLVQRLKELSSGGAMSCFQWNGGGSFGGKPWKEDYPTDTAILLHMFAMYMDSHLPPDPGQPEGRLFSNTFVVKTPEKPPKPASQPVIYLTQMNPPHVKLILPPEEECDVGGGRNNLLHTLLLLIHDIVYERHSRINNINMDMSGINLSWVVTR